MRINADFTQPVVVRFDQTNWTPSPMAGVERLMLDRLGGEVAQATSLVRYAPRSRFGTHIHDFGEEFLVLEGTFSDADGDYRAGAYVRNPPGSGHAPWSGPGCTIFVKLRQFDGRDRARVVVDTLSSALPWTQAAPGAACLPLHRFEGETVRLLRLESAATMELPCGGGLEALVVEGAVDMGKTALRTRDWLRLPPGPSVHLRAGPAGARLYIKSGHLRAPENIAKSGL